MQHNNMAGTTMPTAMPQMNMTPTGGLPKAKSPKYMPNTRVQLLANHMPGMQGAGGTVVGAYNCAAYAVDVTGASGEVLHGHRWAIAEEIRDGNGKTFQTGDAVQLARGHIAGMAGKNAQATIVQVHPGPVYMVDYTPTNGRPPVKNHQWVVEDELQPATPVSIRQ